MNPVLKALGLPGLAPGSSAVWTAGAGTDSGITMIATKTMDGSIEIGVSEWEESESGVMGVHASGDHEQVLSAVFAADGTLTRATMYGGATEDDAAPVLEAIQLYVGTLGEPSIQETVSDDAGRETSQARRGLRRAL